MTPEDFELQTQRFVPDLASGPERISILPNLANMPALDERPEQTSE